MFTLNKTSRKVKSSRKVRQSRRLLTEQLETREMMARTTGLMVNTAESYPGYTLFAPSTTKTTYLINQNGERVHSWQSDYLPMTAELMPNGDILRAGLLPANPRMHASGSSGILERFNWAGERTWFYKLNTNQYRSHHDFEVLPNGNILLIAWEYHTKADAIANGRDPKTIEQGSLWPDVVLEIKPRPRSGGDIVWKWSIWDHMLQNRDPNKPNYMNPAKHPERIDINYRREGTGQGGFPADWAHTNAIDYDPITDQIMLSPREFSELWVIDHSTTTAEARGSKGGKHGKGGDLLYRWGNPAAYKQGTFQDQVLSYQHDTQFIKPGLRGEGNFLVFNNGWVRPNGNYSSVDEIAPLKERQWLLNNQNSGISLSTFGFNTGEVPAGWIPVTGDWNGNGKDSTGLYNPNTSTWYLNNNSNGRTTNVIEVSGWNVPKTWRPIAGDWDGDGRDTIGFYDRANKTWHLNNRNDGSATNVLVVHTPGAPDTGTPLVGDWNGDGKDSPGMYAHLSEKWYFTNGTGSTATFTLIIQGPELPNNFQPVVGDWNNNGKDSPGIWNPANNRWFLVNQLIAPTKGVQFTGAKLPQKFAPIVGNWDGKGGDSVGLYNKKFLYGTYLRAPGKPFGPATPTSTYTGTPRSSFFAPIISGAQRLPNGNTLIDEGTTGRIFEVNAAGKIVWQYVNPATSKGILRWDETIPKTEGILGSIANANLVFRAYRYGLNYSAFNGRDLSPKGRIEIGGPGQSGASANELGAVEDEIFAEF